MIKDNEQRRGATQEQATHIGCIIGSGDLDRHSFFFFYNATILDWLL